MLARGARPDRLAILSRLAHLSTRHAAGDPTNDRRDANYGHTLIDFGGQWLLAHLVARAVVMNCTRGKPQLEVLEAGYPRTRRSAAGQGSRRRTTDDHGSWTSSQRPRRPQLSGPLYPPTHAVLFAPLGTLAAAGSVSRGSMLYFWRWAGLPAWRSAGLAADASGGRRRRCSSWSFRDSPRRCSSAQNSVFSLAILLVGWWFVCRGWDVAGGVVWGLLAYKPVWAAAFLLVPLLTRRWRMAGGDDRNGPGADVGHAAVRRHSNPGCDWLRVGQTAADLYKVDDNWVFLSRDLLGIPRRWLLNFDEPRDTRDRRHRGGSRVAHLGGRASSATGRRGTPTVPLSCSD